MALPLISSCAKRARCNDKRDIKPTDIDTAACSSVLIPHALHSILEVDELTRGVADRAVHVQLALGLQAVLFFLIVLKFENLSPKP